MNIDLLSTCRWKRTQQTYRVCGLCKCAQSLEMTIEHDRFTNGITHNVWCRLQTRAIIWFRHFCPQLLLLFKNSLLKLLTWESFKAKDIACIFFEMLFVVETNFRENSLLSPCQKCNPRVSVWEMVSYFIFRSQKPNQAYIFSTCLFVTCSTSQHRYSWYGLARQGTSDACWSSWGNVCFSTKIISLVCSWQFHEKKK